MTPDERARVFARFFRGTVGAGPGPTPQPPGAGPGLAIARWVAEAHGGRLTLARSGPEGSAFVVALPAPAAGAPPAP